MRSFKGRHESGHYRQSSNEPATTLQGQGG